MGDDVTYENLGVNTGGVPADTVIETVQQGAGEQRQVVSVGDSVLPAGGATEAAQTPPVTTPTTYNVTLTNADTEYSQALPANTRDYRFMCRTEFDVRFAFVTGKVATPTAPYLTLPLKGGYSSDMNNLTALTIYFASSEAGVVVELEAWA